jgi:environmental stress-induced protein Ves
MTLHLIDVTATQAQPWRNGGGQTRELLVWPATGPWQLRISRADIDRDGAFSAFAGVTRWFSVLEGAGVTLQLGAKNHVLRPGDAALCFEGEQAPDCHLLDGPTQDLNLMTLGGDAVMALADVTRPWQSAHRMRGLYTTAAGRWSDGTRQQPLPSHHLLWDDAAEPDRWTFEPDTGASGTAWWLGCTPAE